LIIRSSVIAVLKTGADADVFTHNGITEELGRVERSAFDFLESI
jgi:hypothetical protein